MQLTGSQDLSYPGGSSTEIGERSVERSKQCNEGPEHWESEGHWAGRPGWALKHQRAEQRTERGGRVQ
jgi:hypothetical protein